MRDLSWTLAKKMDDTLSSDIPAQSPVRWASGEDARADMSTGRNSLPYLAACAGRSPGFMAGTRIRTPGGVVAVEALRPGDPVLTADGRVDVVRRLGRQTVSTLSTDPAGVPPIRLRAGALGEGMPSRDLLLSPHHAVLIEGVLVRAGALVNGGSIVRCADLPASVVYHQVEPAGHALILAEDVPAATVPDADEALYGRGQASAG
jgi:hypothetical protein